MTGHSRIPCAPSLLPASATGIAGSDAVSEHQAAKAALRAALRSRRRSIEPAAKQQWDERIGEQVLAWCRAGQVPSLGVYWPIHGEPDLRAAYEELVQAGVRLALPVVVTRDAPLAFAAWTPGDPLVTDGMGVMVPGDLHFVERPPALLLPCLGFNAQGYRLGYGGGYYDRTLEATPRPYTLGIAYACLQAQFGHAAHDVPLDVVVTEETNVA
ncbi:5-formyltetrahydrofolate cyclo-ligase [Massilia horti]|uniref:5-formyltetrahydrofolate cyclo-ligase n=1 Tax=Massilia horti TaxID=2562153 RepID=A0A4Y9SX40_9BURK|nr:5-formyltetrahydrofolate cyclo-ligase [Massilia horti]